VISNVISYRRLVADGAMLVVLVCFCKTP